MALVGEHANCLIKCPGNFTTLLTNYSYWGSPGGKLDWGVQGDELHKFLKSASFGFRGQSGMPAATAAEPDVSWVNSLVKDGHTGDHFPQWLEQEQMVA
ncbi:zinc finger CCCH domain-containing protein 33 [Hordeum vulgare]|nr:zinc finger CCCH domain-containing protein 33 [Hordeum vulgare]